MNFRHLPVKSLQDVTRNFEQLQSENKGADNSAAIAYRAAAQTISNATFNAVKVDTANDPGKHFDLVNGWYVVPADGFYSVSGNVAIPDNKPNTVVLASVGLNGVEASRSSRLYHEATAETNYEYGLAVSALVYAKAGDHIELYAYQNTGVGVALLIGTMANQLCVVKVG
jgi:hypothetical protein